MLFNHFLPVPVSALLSASTELPDVIPTSRQSAKERRRRYVGCGSFLLPVYINMISVEQKLTAAVIHQKPPRVVPRLRTSQGPGAQLGATCSGCNSRVAPQPSGPTRSPELIVIVWFLSRTRANRYRYLYRLTCSLRALHEHKNGN